MNIFSVYSPNFDALHGLVRPLWDEYANRNGHEIMFLREENNGPFAKFHYCFLKIQRLLDTLDGLTWVIDLDVIPTNMTVDIDWFIVKEEIAMGRDINGLNCGSMILSDKEVTRLWLSSIMALRSQASSEQNAMNLLEEAYAPNTNFIEGINSIPYQEYQDFGFKKKDHYSQWEPGHLTCHLPGCKNEFRVSTFQKYLPLIVR